MRAVAVTFAFALLLFGSRVAVAEMPRAASTTLCGDQYLLALAAPEQIASLSWQATSPLSHYAAQAAPYPQNRGGVEELVAAGTELVVLSQRRDPQTLRVLNAFDIAYVEVEMTAGFEGVAANVRLVADALGRREVGAAVIARMEARLAELARGPKTQSPLIAYYRPGGGGAGLDTFVDGVLRAAGYRNLQSELGQSGWGPLPAEALIRQPPDAFVISFFDTAAASVRTRLGRNPILADAMNRGHVIAVPGKYWLCAHPLLVNATATLAAERGNIVEATP